MSSEASGRRRRSTVFVNVDKNIDFVARARFSMSNRWAFFTQDGNFVRLEPGQRFPTPRGMALLPETIRATLRFTALGVIQRILLPIIVRRIRGAARTLLVKSISDNPINKVSSPSTNQLTQLPIFNRWDKMSQVVDCMTPTSFIQGQVIVFEGEPSQTGLFFVTYGTVAAAAPLPNSPSGAVHGSVAGDVNLLSGQPHRATIRCTSPECIVWVLPEAAYLKYFNQQNDAVKDACEELAVQQRLAFMRVAYRSRLAPKVLGQLPEFHSFTAAMLGTVVERMQPRVLRRGAAVFQAADPAASLFVLLTGSVRLEPTFGAATTLRAPCVFGGMSWVQNLPRGAACTVGGAHCDCFVVVREALKSELALCGTSSVPRLHEGDGDVTYQRHLVHVQQIPLLRQVLARGAPPAAAMELAAAFASRLFRAGGTVVGTSEQVDQILIPLSGVARVLPMRKPLAIGEAIGFCVLVAHRWLHRIVAVTDVEMLSLEYDVYLKILTKHGLVKPVRALTTALMVPDERSVTEDVRAEAMAATAALRSPALHPVTASCIQRAPHDVECRRPTEKMLARLAPISLITGMPSCVYSSASKSRITVRDLSVGRAPPAVEATAGPQAGSLAAMSPIMRGRMNAKLQQQHGQRKSNTIVRERPPTPSAVVKPLVLGKHSPSTFRYKQRLPSLTPDPTRAASPM
jgi:CRP-like cAMP-binding protein